MKKIVLTGGGTAGHVTPNLALVPKLHSLGYDIHYVGSYTGIEKELVENMHGITYHGISSGKLRRYFSVQNMTDIYRIFKGYTEAKKLLSKIKPDVIFSKGGFVTVPVVKAGATLRIPIIIHESDMTPGLANRLSNSSAWKVCCNFPETYDLLPKDKAVLTGLPIRKEILHGDKNKGLELLGFNNERPVFLVMGGSTGSVAVNEAIRESIQNLVRKYQVVHVCGKDKVDTSVNDPSYRQFEYLSKELPDILAAADLVVTRAGANAICELLALKLPNLLIPLPAASSRGDQLLNAKSFVKHGYSMVLQEEDITTEKLVENIDELYQNRAKYRSNMKQAKQQDAVNLIVQLIEEAHVKIDQG